MVAKGWEASITVSTKFGLLIKNSCFWVMQKTGGIGRDMKAWLNMETQ